MTPTLDGRIQSRIWLLLVVGGVWTLLIGLLINAIYGEMGTLGSTYRVLFVVLLLVLVLGILWELLYHQLMLRRWEKDWPSLYGFVTLVNEGILVYLVLRFFGDSIPGLEGTPPLGAFLLHFITTWIVVWLWSQGPMRVLFIRWRYNGGRIVGGV